MNRKTFCAGDKVTIKQSGAVGRVVDVILTTGGYLYGVQDGMTAKPHYFYEDEIEAEAAQKQYKFTITRANNLMYAIMTDEEGNEIARGHGHIFHSGEYGVAQAASYAMKLIKDQLDGGNE